MAVIGFVVIFIIFFAVVFLVVFFWLLSKKEIGWSAGIARLALVPVELLLRARLRIGSSPEGTHGNFEFPAAKGADSDCRSGAQPFGNPKAALEHGHLFLRVWHSALLGY
jgi:hypothetical protein